MKYLNYAVLGLSMGVYFSFIHVMDNNDINCFSSSHAVLDLYANTVIQM